MKFQFSIRDLLLIVAIVALAAGWWIDHQRIAQVTMPPVPTTATIQKWEYETRQDFSGYAGELSVLGEAGWEVCGVDGHTVILKRPKN